MIYRALNRIRHPDVAPATIGISYPKSFKCPYRTTSQKENNENKNPTEARQLAASAAMLIGGITIAPSALASLGAVCSPSTHVSGTNFIATVSTACWVSARIYHRPAGATARWTAWTPSSRSNHVSVPINGVLIRHELRYNNAW